MSTDAQPDVALIAPYPSPGFASRSGVAWYSQNLARALVDEGASVTVVSPADERARSSDFDGGVRVRRCFELGPAAVLKAAGQALDTGAPVVHIQHEAFLFGGPTAVPGLIGGLARLRRRGTGPVVTLHQVVSPNQVDRAFTNLHGVSLPAPIARLGLSALQGSINRISRATIVHEAAFARSVPRSVVVPLGSHRSADSCCGNDSTFRSKASAQREAHGIAPDDFVVLCFGFAAPYKGLETALAAAEIAGPPVRLVVAGAEHPRLAGTGYLDSLRRRFGATAAFTGYVADPDVAGWFHAADVALLAYPSAFSSSGVLSIALEHGLATLLSPALAELADVPVRLAAPLDPGLLAKRLRCLAKRGFEMSELSMTSRALSEGRSWPQVARRHLEIYEWMTDA